jgi:putative ABC transport system substrate-binding protein
MNARRRSLQALAAVAAVAAFPGAARAQAKGSLPRVGILAASSRGAASSNSPAAFMRIALKEYGYADGENIQLEVRSGLGRMETLREAAAELARLPVALILAMGPGPTAAARAATATIPIVMGNHDAVEQGIVPSLSRPGGNVTGWSFSTEEVAAKQLELLREAIPRLSRIGLLYNPDSQGAEHALKSARAATRAQGLTTVQALEVAKVEALEPAFAQATRAGLEALLVFPEPLVIDEVRPQLAALAARQRLPAIALWRSYADSGLLMTYGPNLPALIRRHVYFMDRILKGAKPSELPIERPLQYEFVVNMKAADALGVKLPQELLLRATDVLR